MSRLTIGVVLAVSLASHVVLAESQAEIAARENDEGKELMFATKYPDASAKFRDAVARVPEAGYFFNLCTSLYQEGKFGEALTACNSAVQNNADEKLKDKTAKLVQKIKDTAAAQHVDLQPAGGGGGDPNVGTPDPNTGNPTTGTPDPNTGNPTGTPGPNTGNPTTGTPVTGAAAGAYGVGRPPEGSVIAAGPPEHAYTWTLGFDLLGGVGQIGAKNFYGQIAGGFRIKGDYMLIPAAKLGGELYLQYQHLAASNQQVVQQGGAYDLDVIDVGVAAYKHLCLPSVQRLCLTPLVGAQLALLSPADSTDSTGSQVFNYAAIGGRAQITADIAFGRHYEHVFSAGLGVNVYSASLSSPSDASAMSVGLDQPGAIAFLSLGYTYRFNTPLGRAPFIILE